jgi:hypothetical protein
MSRRGKSSTAKVFISHSHEDRHLAVELQRVLGEQNAQTFLDQDRIDTLDNLPDRVREGISWCDSLLLLWSASAAASAWVRREWETAHKWGKTIIPYVLDAAPLPYLLDELVYVDASDSQHGNAKLLKAVFGSDVQVDPRTLFPGLWEASVDAFGMAQGIYNFELRENGQVEGDGGISDSGLAGQLAGEMGMSGLMSMRIPLHGSWSYDRGSQTLTIETSTSVVFGRQQNDTIRIRATGHEKGAITGEDLAGRTWTLRRVGDRPRSQAENEKQRIREVLQNMIDNGRDSPTLPVTLAAVCLGTQEKSEFNLGLPTKKARQVMQADASTFSAAVQNFVQALERGGWIM